MNDLIWQILTGGLLGAMGQMVRSVGGMKKVHDTASATGQSFGDVFETSQLVISLLIGFTAGALAILVAGLTPDMLKTDRGSLMAIIAAGYSGTDFIEAFMTRAMPPADPGAAAGRDKPPAVG